MKKTKQKTNSLVSKFVQEYETLHGSITEEVEETKLKNRVFEVMNKIKTYKNKRNDYLNMLDLAEDKIEEYEKELKEMK